MYAGVVVLDYTTLAVVECKGLVSTTDFPYIPGLLSFREAPACCRSLLMLDSTPDVVVFDGQGIAHPRGLGIASHMGLLLDVPAIGCAKSRLTGRYEEPPLTRGAHTPLYGGNGQVLGAVLRTKDRTKPVSSPWGTRWSYPRRSIFCCTVIMATVSRSPHDLQISMLGPCAGRRGGM